MRQNIFSEFSYGYAVTRESESNLGPVLLLPPEFPSLSVEGSSLGGFDLCLQYPSAPVYLQFKLTDYLYGPKSGQRYLFSGAPYYRFWLRNTVLRCGQTQHELLLNLDNEPDNFVWYVAPGFHRENQWTQHYFSSAVSANSIFFAPSELGEVSRDEDHCVVFRGADEPFGWLCSEPKRVVGVAKHRLVERYIGQLGEKSPLKPERLFEEEHKLREIVGTELPRREMPMHHPMMEVAARGRDQGLAEFLEQVARVSFFARTYFDATFAIAVLTGNFRQDS